MTLLLIAIAGAAMVGVSRRAMGRAMEASSAEEGLQRRWGVLSARAALLPRAEGALSAAERAAKSAQASTTISLALGRQRYTLVIFDEQAKLNLNGVYQKGGALEVERTVRQLVNGLDGDDLRLLPLPDSIDPRTKEPVTPIQSLGQVFAEAGPEALLGSEQRPGLARDITCWTDGRINYRRASSEVLQLSCVPPLIGTQVQQLVSARNGHDGQRLAQILPRLGLTEAQRAHVEEKLTDGSSSHSLWIVVQSGRRRWYHLAVSGPRGRAQSHPLLFEW